MNGGPGWYPTIDGDILPLYPTEALRTDSFASTMSHLSEINTKEGTDATPVSAPCDTDDEIYDHLLKNTGSGFSGPTVQKILEYYSDDPSICILANTGADRFTEQGSQYKLIAAILADVFYIAPNQFDTRSYAKFGSAHSKTYAYRFNTQGWLGGLDGVGSSQPAHKGVAHTAEIPFVFKNSELLDP